jgi:ubiquinone/menaquinone biosynthesis C-methylase UbiE
MTINQTVVNEQYKTSDNLSARAALHARFSTNKQRWHRWVFDHLLAALPPKAAILELGCGPGWLWIENVERVPPGWDVLLSDFSGGMLATARHALRSSDHPFLFKRIDAQAIPFVASTFDAVIANHMLYHVPRLDRALAEIRRVLKPGGRLVAATIGARHMKEIPELVFQIDPNIPYGEGLAAPDEFLLENGAEKLQPSFSQVELHLYEDALVVTEVDPLVDYALSNCAPSALTETHVAALRALVKAEMSATGAILVTKAVGLFGRAVSDSQRGQTVSHPTFRR